MIAAGRARLHRFAITVCRAEANGNARHSLYRFNDTNELRWTKRAAVYLESRRKICDADRVAFVIGQLGHHDGGISYVVRSRLDLALEPHVRKSLVLVTGDQPAKHRIAVITRQAPPYDSRGRIEQCRRAAIANDCKIQS